MDVNNLNGEGAFVDCYQPSLSDANDLPAPCRGILAAAAGNIRVITLAGRDVVIPFAANQYLPIIATRVLSTNTTVAVGNIRVFN